MLRLNRIGCGTGIAFLNLSLLFVAPVPALASEPTAIGHFEVYCDGVGIFLAKIDGAPAPEKLVLFFMVGFPPGTIGDRLIGQKKWSDIYVYRDGVPPRRQVREYRRRQGMD